MNIFPYLVPIIFSVIMLGDGVLRYWGKMSPEAAKEVVVHWLFTEKHERHWDYFQKTRGKALFVCSGLNIATMLALISVTQMIIQMCEDGKLESGIIGIYGIVPSLLYGAAARIYAEIKLRRKDDR